MHTDTLHITEREEFQGIVVISEEPPDITLTLSTRLLRKEKIRIAKSFYPEKGAKLALYRTELKEMRK